jgi:antitoxin ChpS
MAIDGGRLVIEPNPRPRYTLAELLAASDYSQPQPPEQREWVDAPAVGGELI